MGVVKLFGSERNGLFLSWVFVSLMIDDVKGSIVGLFVVVLFKLSV